MVMGPEPLDQVQQEVSERKVKEKLAGHQQRGLLSDIAMTLLAAGVLIVIAVIFGFIIHIVR
ncbi:hypothetical protein [Paenibacillus sp. FSL M8-0142]|uniref:hypothetical protein n=1 Tax=Paenibacillus sp. FSL M8-0142 TaxID=2954525 RepID=UPI00315B0674